VHEDGFPQPGLAREGQLAIVMFVVVDAGVVVVQGKLARIDAGNRRGLALLIEVADGEVT
jgi:hypothetical protein